MNDQVELIKQFGKVAVLMGGRSAERDISLMSGNAVLKALVSQGVDAYAFDPAEKDLLLLKTENFSRCFIALHGRYGEDGTIQGALEILGIPYTGSGVMASSIAMNKIMTKNIWQAKGLPTPSWVEVSNIAETLKAFMTLNAPMIVKPALEGSSIGITKVTSSQQCEAAFKLAEMQDSKIICEQFISGDEITCTVLNLSQNIQALPIIKIVAPSGKYDYQNKYFTNDTKYIIPCELPNDEERKIQALVIKAFDAICGRGWARLDVMIDGATRKPYLLEINTAPGMTGHSLSPMSALHYGLSFENLCLKVLATASLDYKNIYNTKVIA
ncbi:MAG: D-alanine--D-alanine ligase [Burkholderiaceae bacterium]